MHLTNFCEWSWLPDGFPDGLQDGPFFLILRDEDVRPGVFGWCMMGCDFHVANVQWDLLFLDYSIHGAQVLKHMRGETDGVAEPDGFNEFASGPKCDRYFLPPRV